MIQRNDGLAVDDRPAEPIARRQLPPRKRLAPIVQSLAAGLLIVAAMLKAYGVATSPQLTLTWHRLAEFALIEFELFLGGVLLLRFRPTITWLAAMATFALFAGYSVRQALLGSASCGCFGPATVSPRLTAALDVAMVLLLLWTGPRTPNTIDRAQARCPRMQRVARLVSTTIIALLMLLSTAAVFAPRPGLIADQLEYDGGTFEPLSGATRDHAFALHNTSGRPTRITSVKTSCSCTAVDYPKDPIAPGASAEIKVHVDWSNVVAGDPQAQVTLSTDHWLTRTIPLLIHARLATH